MIEPTFPLTEAAGGSRRSMQDPGLPIIPSAAGDAAPWSKQRERRAEILATVRRLLVEHGLEGVTMRGIALESRHAVQTIYNLVGPRDEAIIEAISEYTRRVGLMALPAPDDPNALLDVIDHWIGAIEAAPEFCRQVCAIYFTPSREVFYHFRDRQLKAMHGLLTWQKRRGVIRRDVGVHELAEQLIAYSTALCVEWSDRPFPLEKLRRRLSTGFAAMIAINISPEVNWKLAAPRTAR